MRVLILAMLAVAAQAQQPAARVEFEVASVKPGDPTDPSSSGRGTPGSMEMRNATLKTLVRSAYGLNEYQVAGGPKWLDSARFTVNAKFPAGTPRPQIHLMMQSLLADRFQLETHRETKNLREYALVVAPGGHKLQEASQDDRQRARSSQGPRMIRAWGSTVSSLADMLISVVGAPVIDRTGIEGLYNFKLDFAPLQGMPAEDDTAQSIFTAVQQLGLKLEAITGPVEVLVIDRAEKPSEN
jgi:uncharacterized protein (TIGR03435 family)